MFWTMFKNLCRQKGESPNYVAKKLSITSGTVTNWKNGGIPQNATLKKIADYFGVTVEYLLGNDQPSAPSAPVSDEDIKFALFGGEGEITDEMYAEVKRYAEFVLHKYGKK